jgi:hypothetical protein
MKPGHVISLIETTYRISESTEQWLEALAVAASRALGSTQGAMAFRYDAGPGDWVRTGPPAFHRLAPQFGHDLLNQPDAPPQVAQAMAQEFKLARFHTLRGLGERLGLSSVFGAVLERHRIDDLLCINGLDPSGRGCMLTIADRKRSHSPRSVHIFQRLAAHISAGNRLRATLDSLGQAFDPVSAAEAILSPNGKVEHATAAAEPRSAREALRDALVRIDKARSERDDARRSVDLWRGLVAGRWSLVEHFERDGKRYYLAHKNDPELAENRGLTPRERLVLGYAEFGHSNKLICYALGLSSSTVSTLLNRGRKKLGILS